MAKVYLGMSGGVDSSVSALLLKQQGYDVVGVYMKNWSKDLPGMKCPWAEDLADAKRVAVKLGLDFEVWDFEDAYKKRVVDYMLAEFQKGRTPNPDVMCNQEIKFKLFYEEAMKRGADFIATGHYARTERINTPFFGRKLEETKIAFGGHKTWPSGPERSSKSNFSPSLLLRSTDENKDQTYFLNRISQESLDHTLFPIGNMLKPDVKKLAEQNGLHNAYKKESMGVCFVGEVGMKDFLKEFLPDSVKLGEIRDADTDEFLGHHDGAIFYTIGQRHGLYVGGGLPYYVVKKDIAKNIVYVSKNLNNENLWTNELELEDIFLRPTGHQPTLVRLAHRGKLFPCVLKGEKLIFNEPIKRPAAGQSAALYDGEICLGGGIIKA